MWLYEDMKSAYWGKFKTFDFVFCVEAVIGVKEREEEKKISESADHEFTL